MLLRRGRREDAVQLSGLALSGEEPFGWPGPLRLSSDPSPIPTWWGWAALSTFALYGAAAAGRGGDGRWALVMAVVAALAGLLGWRFQREGVWVDAEGLTARDLFGTTRVPWSDAADIIAAGALGRSHTWVERTDGTRVVLAHIGSRKPAVADGGVRPDLQILGGWWQTGRQRAALRG
jgi:hypothetical protein